jgi:hypothetical protein
MAPRPRASWRAALVPAAAFEGVEASNVHPSVQVDDPGFDAAR